MSTMHTVPLARPDDFEGWRRAARAHLLAGTTPEAIVWDSGQGTADLFGHSQTLSPPTARPAPGQTRGAIPAVPAHFLDLAERVSCHRDAGRFALLYRVLWRVTRGETGLLKQLSDPDMHRLHRWGKCVARERHKMHAFVRFRQTPGIEPEHFGAWFEPEHHTLRLSSGFFVRRFPNMHWSIVTPEESVHWDGQALVFGPGGQRDERAASEVMEELWRTYFASTFNPARLRLDAMQSEMPVKYWKNLPEAQLIAGLVHDAGTREQAMLEALPTDPPRFADRATAPKADTHKP